MRGIETMNTIRQAWVFAGHGSQYPGMGRGFDFDSKPVAPIFEQAERLSGLPLRTLSMHGSADELRAPRVLEPLLLAFSLSYAAKLRAKGLRPVAVAGYSAGMLAALACAEVLSTQDALALSVRRGVWLTASAHQCPGGMLAVQGLLQSRVIDIVAGAGGSFQASTGMEDIEVSGWNAPTHLTLAGPVAALNKVAVLLTQAGARCHLAPVAAAWHSRRASRIAARLENAMDDVCFRPPLVPVYSSVSGRREVDPLQLRRHLAQQIATPVYWQAALTHLCADEKVREVLEVSCGRTLAAMQTASASSGSSPAVLSSGDAVVFPNLYQQLKADYA
jgi:[acyl-carrier-protein] S-malonyltransferase